MEGSSANTETGGISDRFVEDGGRKAVRNLKEQRTRCGCVPGYIWAHLVDVFHTIRIILSYPLILIVWENGLFERSAFSHATSLLLLNVLFYYVPIGLLIDFGVRQSVDSEYNQKDQNTAMWGCILYVHLPVIYSIVRG